MVLTPREAGEFQKLQDSKVAIQFKSNYTIKLVQIS